MSNHVNERLQEGFADEFVEQFESDSKSVINWIVDNLSHLGPDIKSKIDNQFPHDSAWGVNRFNIKEDLLLEAFVDISFDMLEGGPHG